MLKLLLLALALGASLLLSISSTSLLAATQHKQALTTVENSSQTSYIDLYTHYGDEVIYNFVFPGGISGGYNAPPSQELYDHHWKSAVEMLIASERDNRTLAAALPPERAHNALTGADKAKTALEQLKDQNILDCWARHDCPPLQVESLLMLTTVTDVVAGSNVSAPADYQYAEWLRPRSMYLQSYAVSATQRAAEITITFETTPTPAGYALNIDFYLNDSDDSHLGPGIYYSRKTNAFGIPASYPPLTNFEIPLLPSAWDNGYLKRYSTKVIFGARVKPDFTYRILWETEPGDAVKDNGLIRLNAQYKWWDCDHVLCLGSIEATCTDFWKRYDYPEKFPGSNVIPVTDSFLQMNCFNSEEIAELFLPVVVKDAATQ